MEDEGTKDTNSSEKESEEDKWGDTALCMAARKGDAAFAQGAGRESWTQSSMA